MAKPKRRTSRAPLPSEPPRADWDRSQFTVRMTAARRERLRSIASDMPAGSTPNDALDRAVERALASGVQKRENTAIAMIEGLEELIASGGAALRDEAKAIRAESAITLSEVRRIADLISAVASLPSVDEGDGDEWDMADEASPSPQSLRSWLDAAARVGDDVVAVGRWRSKTRLGDNLVAMTFEVAAEGDPSRAVVSVEPIEVKSPLARTDEAIAVRLACRRSETGWSVEVRHLNHDRSVGAPICAIRV